jgi:predicted outer membrane protein
LVEIAHRGNRPTLADVDVGRTDKFAHIRPQPLRSVLTGGKVPRHGGTPTACQEHVLSRLHRGLRFRRASGFRAAGQAAAGLLIRCGEREHAALRHRRCSMLRLATIVATSLAGMLFATSAMAQIQVCPVSRMITASGTETPGMPPKIYYIYPESGEIQAGLDEPVPAPISCQGGILVIEKKDQVGTTCEFRFRFTSTNTGSPLTEVSPANCPSLQLSNLKWAAPIASRMTERKIVYALWAANDAAIRYTAIVVGVAKDGGVRSLADEMKTEHGDLNNRLATTFADMQTNWSASPAPPGVASDVSNAITIAAEAKRRAMLSRAVSNNLAGVDKQFVQDEYKFHTKMVMTIEKFIAESKFDRPKAFLAESLDVFKRHIMHAEMLATAIGLTPQELAQLKKQQPFPAP